MRQPLRAGEVIDLAAGEAGKQVTIWVVPQGKRFVVECVGVNAFAAGSKAVRGASCHHSWLRRDRSYRLGRQRDHCRARLPR
jgi:hypothetical protein